MNLCVVGLDHTTAPVEVRERLAFSPADLPAALLQLTSRHNGGRPLLAEAAIISTCNRVEVYGVAADAGTPRNIVRFLSEFHDVPEEEFAPSLFFYAGKEVADHLCATAAGLNSLVLGEAQIQGQVRNAHEVAQQVGTLGPILSRLFRQAIVAGKRVRHETELGQGAASISQAGVELALRRLGSLEGKCILLVGSGQVSELAAQNLLANGAGDLLIVNRTLAHGLALSERYGARNYSYDELTQAMARADIVISSTAAPVTVIHRQHIQMALQARHSRNGFAVHANGAQPVAEMMLIDLAVPRDIDADVAEIPGIHLYTVDDLQDVVNQTLERRAAAVAKAKKIVAYEADAFKDWMASREALPALSTLRRHAEDLRNAELKRAYRQLGDLSPEQWHAVEALSRSLVNKLLHSPTVRLKQAATNGDGQRYAAMLCDLFDLEFDEPEPVSRPMVLDRRELVRDKETCDV